MGISFTQRLRQPIMDGEITVSVRFWHAPRVKVGGRYPLGPGAVVVSAIREITLSDITPRLAQQSGFLGVVDMLKVARHGSSDRIFLVEFAYEPGDGPAVE